MGRGQPCGTPASPWTLVLPDGLFQLGACGTEKPSVSFHRAMVTSGAAKSLQEQGPSSGSSCLKRCRWTKSPLDENKHQDMTVNTKCAWHFTARCAIPRSRCAWSSRSAPGVVLGSAAEMAKHALGAGPRREASGPTFTLHARLGRKVLSSTPTLQVANCVPQMEGTERGRRPGPGIWVPTRPALP